MMMNIPLD